MKLILIVISIQLIIIWKLCEISTQLYNYHVLQQIELGHIEDYLKKGQKHE
jgi:hypothetical protein